MATFSSKAVFPAIINIRHHMNRSVAIRSETSIRGLILKSLSLISFTVVCFFIVVIFSGHFEFLYQPGITSGGYFS